MIASVLAVLFFAPAAFIYGRHRARYLKAQNGTLGSRLSSLVPIPALFVVCAVIAIIYEREKGVAQMLALRGQSGARSTLSTGNGAVDFALTIARWIGDLELILFMVAMPFIMGAIVAAVLLILDARGTIRLGEPARQGDVADHARQEADPGR